MTLDLSREYLTLTTHCKDRCWLTAELLLKYHGHCRTEHVTNKEVLHRTNKSLLRNAASHQFQYLGHVLRGSSGTKFLNEIVEKIEGK